MYAFFRQYEFSREHGTMYALASPWYASKAEAYQSGHEAANDPTAELLSVGDVDAVQSVGLYRLLSVSQKASVH